MVAIRGADRADTVDGGRVTFSRRLTEVGDELDGPTLAIADEPVLPTVSARDLDVLRTRLELLHDMNDRDRREREQHRQAVQAAVAEMQRQVAEVQRDHRSIRQTVGDLATMVRRHSADGSAVREAFDALRTAVVEVRDEGRAGLRQVQQDSRRAVEQLEAHAGTTELEHVAVLREQLAETIAVIEELAAATKRQAGQITRLRADLKKATTAAAAPSPAKRPAAKKASSTASRQKGRAARRPS